MSTESYRSVDSLIWSLVVELTRLAIPSAAAQGAQVVLMIFLSRSAGALSLTHLAASGFAEIVMVVFAIQPLIAFGMGISAAVSNKIGKQEKDDEVSHGSIPSVSSNSRHNGSRNRSDNECDGDESAEALLKRSSGNNNSPGGALVSWQTTNAAAVHTFWAASIITVMLSVFVCTPLVMIAGPAVMVAAGVSPHIAFMSLRQLLFGCLFIYPLLFAAFVVLAALATICRQSELLTFSSLPVVIGVVPLCSSIVLPALFPEFFSLSASPSSPHGPRLAEAFHTLALCWLAAMAVELIGLYILCSSRVMNIIPPFGKLHFSSNSVSVSGNSGSNNNNSGSSATVPVVTSSSSASGSAASAEKLLPWAAYARRLIADNSSSAITIVLEWLLPALFCFVAGHTAFEVAFLMGGASAHNAAVQTVAEYEYDDPVSSFVHQHTNPMTTTSSAAAAGFVAPKLTSPIDCNAATLVVAHQVRFATTLIPHAVITAFNAVFSREIGAKRLNKAAAAIATVLVLLVVITSVEGLLVLLLADVIPGWFHSGEACIVKQFGALAPTMGFALVCEYMIWCVVTALRCLGRGKESVIITLCAWWGVTLPAAGILVYVSGNGAASVFEGALIGQAAVVGPAIWYMYKVMLEVFPSHLPGLRSETRSL